MRVRLTIDATIDYDADVLQTFADIRLLPSERGNYSQLALKVDVEPAAWQNDYVDIYGTRVMTVHAVDPHAEFAWHAQAELEIDHELLAFLQEDDDDAEVPAVAVSRDATWDEVEQEDRQDRWIDFLGEVAGVKTPAKLTKSARELETPFDAITYVASELALENPKAKPALAEADEQTEKLLGAFRSIKIPARYVFGFLIDGDISDADELEVRLSSWVEVWCGVWLPIDASKGELMPPDAMTIGYGRDRADVQPIRALHAGPASAQAKVTATITRIS